MMMKAVQPEQVDGVWGRVAPLLRRFRAKYDDGPTLGALYDLLQGGHRQMYVVVDDGDLRAVVLTSIGADGKTMEVPCVAGSDAPGWAQGVIDNIVGMAEANGIEKLHIHFRPGWMQMLSLRPSDGWRETARVFERKL